MHYTGSLNRRHKLRGLKPIQQTTPITDTPVQSYKDTPELFYDSVNSEVVDNVDIPSSEPLDSYVTYLKVRINHSKPIADLEDVRASTVVALGAEATLVVLESIQYRNGQKISISTALF